MQIAIDLPNDFVSFQSAADIGKDMRLSYSESFARRHAKTADIQHVPMPDTGNLWGGA